MCDGITNFMRDSHFYKSCMVYYPEVPYCPWFFGSDICEKPFSYNVFVEEKIISVSLKC